MISTDQDGVTQRAREATPEDVADEAEARRLATENEDRLSRIDTLTPVECGA